MKKVIYTLIFFLLLFGCKSYECGCTIKNETINFDYNAKCDDGSCIFYSNYYIRPDSIEKYNVDLFIDNQFVIRINKLNAIGGGYVVKFPSNEIHFYLVRDDFGRVWQDTFETFNEYKIVKTIRLSR